VIWNASSRDVLKLIYGQGFRLPTVYEEYYTDGESQFANTDLKPEVLTSEQLTWVRKWTPQLNSTASVIFYRSENSIFAVADGAGAEQYQNASDPIKGTAGQMEVAWHRGGTELYSGLGSYHFTYQGATLDDSTRWLANFKAIQHLGDWSLAGEARYVGGRSNQDTVTGVPASVPANWTLRASVRREWAWGWGQVSVEDLTNSRRQDLVGQEYAPITWMEADGRAVNATLGVRF
jgi:iron complex outermembrane receptor protein